MEFVLSACDVRTTVRNPGRNPAVLAMPSAAAGTPNMDKLSLHTANLERDEG